ncbi:hypothetical protein KCP74_04120 [Salmonella enterica subsp. enterica]|nr:hypothetical protein KCP74_04120 [Salmonella enterica subsp. enterica]
MKIVRDRYVALVAPIPSVPSFIMAGITSSSVGDSRHCRSFMTAIAIFCRFRGGDGDRVESSCAGGDAVMYRAGGDTRWLLFCWRPSVIY